MGGDSKLLSSAAEWEDNTPKHSHMVNGRHTGRRGGVVCVPGEWGLLGNSMAQTLIVTLQYQ